MRQQIGQILRLVVEGFISRQLEMKYDNLFIQSYWNLALVEFRKLKTVGINAFKKSGILKDQLPGSYKFLNAKWHTFPEFFQKMDFSSQTHSYQVNDSRKPIPCRNQTFQTIHNKCKSVHQWKVSGTQRRPPSIFCYPDNRGFCPAQLITDKSLSAQQSLEYGEQEHHSDQVENGW